MIDPKEKLRKVELTPPDPLWEQLYKEAKQEITSVLQRNLSAIHHIGSTAIPHIYAKPIVDVLPVVKDLSVIDALNPAFIALGYRCMGEYGIPGRRFYWKSEEKRTHNVHLFAEGSPEVQRHLLFRDFMRAHKDYAQAYSMVKQNLAEVFPYDIESYVNGKSSFVQRIDYLTGKARKEQLEAKDEVQVQPYNPVWPLLAAAEIQTIKGLAKHLPHLAMEHIGSTAVAGLASKPIIDLLIIIPTIEQAQNWIEPLDFLGYVFWDENPDKEHLRFFKGMPPFGNKRTHHIHLVGADNKIIKPRLLFRDILIANAQIRNDYERLKKNLAELYPLDREAYTENKGEFINQVLNKKG
ncbi:GrpB family protein [Legionella sp. km772]|uniref:GrpB family protein n=1 Tax=Legionella sp. km772 TaxID=2498111 RepID=UPI000F8CA37C|nr:GrpB family protein [Legionella sp. km772]RUR12043.1 GrpB family protein [Legionella sp. km772]